MIKKLKLSSAISKYYLNGLNNQVKWRVKDNQLTVYSGREGKLCKIDLKNFPLPDCELGIFDTEKLTKLLSITAGDLILDLKSQNKLHEKLLIQDANFNLSYSLGDLLLFRKDSYLQDPEEWDVILELTQDDIANLVKGKSALGDVNSMVVEVGVDEDKNPICNFVFGDTSSFSNKITYQIFDGEFLTDDLKIPFDSDIFKNILAANKDQDTCVLKLAKKIGLMKINFESEDITSEYYLTRNERF